MKGKPANGLKNAGRYFLQENDTLTQRLAILEDRPETAPIGYDHVFSLPEADAHSFADDYMREDEVPVRDLEILNSLVRILSSSQVTKTFDYQGVNLLWCLKKRFLNLMGYCDVRMRLMERVLEKCPAHRVDFLKRSEEAYLPSLATIMKHSHLGATLSLGWISGAGKPANLQDRGSRAKEPFWEGLLPGALTTGNLNNYPFGVFSDLAKVETLIRRIGENKTVVYTDKSSPRLFVRQIRNGGGYYQAALNDRLRGTYRKLSSEFFEKYKELHPFSNFKLGSLNWQPLLDSYAAEVFQNELLKLLFDIDQMAVFFRRASLLKSVVMDEDVSPSKNAFCQMARQFGVKTYVSLHGALGKRNSYVPLTADAIFVWGRAQQNKLIQWGVENERIFPTGYSRYTPYKRMNADEIKKSLCREYGFDPGKPLFLIAFVISRPYRRRLFDRKRRRLLKELLEIVHKKSDIQFIIKAKNALDQNYGLCKAWIHDHPCRHIVVVRDVDPLRLCVGVDAAIIHSSTFAIDCIAMRKPVILWSDGDKEMYQEFQEEKIFLEAVTAEALEQLLTKIALDPTSYRPSPEALAYCLNEGEKDPEHSMIEAMFPAKLDDNRSRCITGAEK